jgi:hypothetical protein
MNGNSGFAVFVNGKRYEELKYNSLESAQKWAEKCIAESPESDVWIEHISGQRWDIDRESGEWSYREAPLTDNPRGP